MPLFPLFVDLDGQACLVVGAGTVGTRRARALLDYGCRVTVVAPAISAGVEDLANRGLVTLHQRGYQESDQDGMDLVVAASDAPELNHRIVADAIAAGRLANDASRASPPHGGFAFPALVRRGELVVGITSSGTDHALAKSIRQDIEAQLAARKDPST